MGPKRHDIDCYPHLVLYALQTYVITNWQRRSTPSCRRFPSRIYSWPDGRRLAGVPSPCSSALADPLNPVFDLLVDLLELGDVFVAGFPIAAAIYFQQGAHDAAEAVWV